MESFNFFGICFGVLLLVSQIYGHSYLTNPISRSNQQQTLTGCRGPACLGPCDIPLASAHRAPITIARGDSINPQWPRNNHAGGFIRFSWAPTDQSDDPAYFDAGVDSVFCHEIGGCGPSDPSNPNGGDTNPSDGSLNPCQTTITVPNHLADGPWTLQWAWFGGAFALGDYYSCVDYVISGGPQGPATPGLFHGGDYSNPNNNSVCKFFNTDRLHQCINEPCNNPIYPASQQQTGPAYGFAIANNDNNNDDGDNNDNNNPPDSDPTQPIIVTSESVTSAALTSASLTSGHQQTIKLTTGVKASVPATTHKLTTNSQPIHLTSGKHVDVPITTGSITSMNPTPSSSSDSNSCITGYMKCLTSETYSTCAHSVWGVSQPCSVGTTCHVSGNYIYCY